MKQSLTDLNVSAVKCPSVERPGFDPKAGSHFVIIPVAELNKAVMNALQYAKLIHGQSVAVHILFSSKDKNEIEKRWEPNNLDIPLAVLYSPEGSVLGPLKEFIDGKLKRSPKSVVTILIPVITDLKWWQRFLHNQTALIIERAFQNKSGIVTIRVPFSIEQTLTGCCKAR